MIEQYPEFIQAKLDQIKWQGGVKVVSDEQDTYVLLALGERKTGGYSIKVLGATEQTGAKGRYIEVKAKEMAPDPGDIVIQVLTYPVAVYRLPRTDLPIHVEWNRQVHT